MNKSYSAFQNRPSVTPPPQPADHDDEIDLLELAGTLWRGKLMLAGAALIALFIGAYYAYVVAVPKYTSTTTVAISVQSSPIADIESIVSGVSTEDASMNTELEILLSRNVLLQLVERLDLLDDPEFNAALRPEPAFSIGNVMEVVAGLTGATANTGEALTEEDILNKTVENLREAISASVKRDTYVFNVSATTTSRAKSQQVVNTLAEVYIDDQVQAKFDSLETAVTWLSERVTELEQELNDGEDRLQQLRTETDLITPEALQAVNRQLIDVRNRLEETRADVDAQAAEVAMLTGALETEDLELLAEELDDPILTRLRSEAQAGDAEARQSFLDRAGMLVSRQETTLARLRSQSAALEASMRRQENELQAQSEDLSALEQLNREIETTRTLYETFLARLKEATVQRGLMNADSRVLSEATPGRYVEPRKGLILALSMVLGLMIGAAVVLGRQFLHQGFRTAEDLEAHTGRTILGQIPKMPIKKRQGLIQYLNDKPTSAAAEAIRNLRTSVLLSDVDHPPQLIMSTSSLPGEGKTTQAISLAHNLAGLGRKVLLIEADIRRRTFQEYFEVPANQPGLVAVMMEEASVEDALVRDPRLKVDVLMGDKSSLNAADVFSSERFKQFLEKMRGIYDTIIIDTPPVLVVPDARVIGQHVDAIAFTTAWDRTTKSQVSEAMRQFATVNVPVTGLVLSQIDHKGMKRYGYGGKYGAYGAYGAGYYDS
ncbi:GumC family protein [Roseivivax sp.]